VVERGLSLRGLSAHLFPSALYTLPLPCLALLETSCSDMEIDSEDVDTDPDISQSWAEMDAALCAAAPYLRPTCRLRFTGVRRPKDPGEASAQLAFFNRHAAWIEYILLPLGPVDSYGDFLESARKEGGLLHAGNDFLPAIREIYIEVPADAPAGFLSDIPALRDHLESVELNVDNMEPAVLDGKHAAGLRRLRSLNYSVYEGQPHTLTISPRLSRLTSLTHLSFSFSGGSNIALEKAEGWPPAVGLLPQLKSVGLTLSSQPPPELQVTRLFCALCHVSAIYLNADGLAQNLAGDALSSVSRLRTLGLSEYSPTPAAAAALLALTLPPSLHRLKITLLNTTDCPEPVPATYFTRLTALTRLELTLLHTSVTFAPLPLEILNATPMHTFPLRDLEMHMSGYYKIMREDDLTALGEILKRCPGLMRLHDDDSDVELNWRRRYQFEGPWEIRDMLTGEEEENGQGPGRSGGARPAAAAAEMLLPDGGSQSQEESD
jgi:hypothetical protein